MKEVAQGTEEVAGQKKEEAKEEEHPEGYLEAARRKVGVNLFVLSVCWWVLIPIDEMWYGYATTTTLLWGTGDGAMLRRSKRL